MGVPPRRGIPGMPGGGAVFGDIGKQSGGTQDSREQSRTRRWQDKKKSEREGEVCVCATFTAAPGWC